MTGRFDQLLILKTLDGPTCAEPATGTPAVAGEERGKM